MASILPPHVPKARGTHALVIGVSRYRFADGPESTPEGKAWGIENLSSAARTASEFAAWLVDEYRNNQNPLASLRVLLSPSDGETIHPSIQARLPRDVDANLEAVKKDLFEFREACRENPDNIGFVYVVGHGVQLTKRESIVLLADFARPRENTLWGALDVVGCQRAMDEDGSAEHQVWFVDACRQESDVVREFEKLDGAFCLDEGKGQVFATPVFLAAATGKQAFAIPGGTSLFLQALLWALRGAAAVATNNDDDEWHVLVTQLVHSLPERVSSLANDHGTDQQVSSTGTVNEMILQQFDAPPDVDLQISLIPELAAAQATGSLLFGKDLTRPPIREWSNWPAQERIPAGMYQLNVELQPQFKQVSRTVRVTPPESAEHVEVTNA